MQRRATTEPGGGVVYALTEYGAELEGPLLALGYWGAKSMGAPGPEDFVSLDSLALALRGSFRPDAAAGVDARYELKMRGKSLRIDVRDGYATIPGSPSEVPDLVVEVAPEVVSALLAGQLDVATAAARGELHYEGDEDDARCLFEMFRFPSADDMAHATVAPPT